MTEITLLSSMASGDFSQALDVHVAHGLRVLDLKDGIFGKSIADLSVEEATRAAALIRARGLAVHCLSTVLFHPDVERGEEAFRQEQLGPLDHLITIAGLLQPTLVRLLAAQTRERAAVSDSIAYLRDRHPWVFAAYAEAIDRLRAAGCRVTIENEVGQCLLATPREVRDFFAALDRPGQVNFTWDIQNFWQMGTFPSLAAYEELKPLIDYVHFKGGRTDGVSRDLCWASALEDAGWPVAAIARQVIRDGVSPVLCLNPSHGKRQAGYAYTDVTWRDLAFLRRVIAEETV